MPNLSALKEKLSAIKTKWVEKTDQIAFVRKWREKSAAAAAAGPKGVDPYSLGNIYREGSTGTRLQVIAFYLFVGIALVSAGSLLKKVATKLKSSAANEQLKQDYSHEVAEAQRKALEEAEMVALGQFTTNAYVGPPKERMLMSIDLWLRVSSPDAAAQINTKNDLFRDKTMDALSDAFNSQANILTTEGKDIVKEKIRASLNSALKKGEVLEVFIQNLVAQEDH